MGWNLQPRAIVDDDRVNAAAPKEVAKHQTGGPTADDSDGRGCALHGRRWHGLMAAHQWLTRDDLIPLSGRHGPRYCD